MIPMKKKPIIILAAIFIIVAGVAVIILKKPNNAVVIQGDDVIIFEKSEGWGPCPSLAVCHQSTKVYYSGALVLEGDSNRQEQLEQEVIDYIINKSRELNIMSKDCSAPIVLDYSANYVLNIDGKQKTIDFPGCEDELREIEKFLP